MKTRCFTFFTLVFINHLFNKEMIPLRLICHLIEDVVYYVAYVYYFIKFFFFGVKEEKEDIIDNDEEEILY